MAEIGMRFIISGRVQGVFFRDSTQKKAIELGITGWVKNSSMGHVECHAFGPHEQIATLENWLWQGPPKAKVVDVRSQNLPYEKFESFEIIYEDSSP